MSDFKAKMHQIRFRPGWVSLQRSPRPPSWISGEGGEGREGEGKGLLIRGGEGREGKKGKGREKDGRGGKWMGLLIRKGGEGRGKGREGPPGYYGSPGSRGARIVTDYHV